MQRNDALRDAGNGERMQVPSQTVATQAGKFLAEAFKAKKPEVMAKLYDDWSFAFEGEPWWKGADTTPEKVGAILHARDVLLPWYATTRVVAQRSKTKQTRVLADCPLPSWAKKPWSKAEQTRVRFSRG